MKSQIRNAYSVVLPVLLMSLAIYFILPNRTGQSQEPDAPEPESPGAVFTVTNSNDSGAGSLRQAIIDANASAGLDTIQFQIGMGAVTISHSTSLPDITGPVIIDGTTQPGFSGTPLITLGGNFTVGLKITGGGSTVKAVALTGFTNGIVFETAGGNIISGSFIGICPQNPGVDCRNFGNGVLINNSPNNLVGGSTDATRNIIGGNSDNGVEIRGSTSSGNIVTGNYIGLLADNTIKKNEDSGVFINGAPNNRVGGTTAAERNVISGNGFDGPFNESLSGVLISGAAATGNTVQGNYIGTTIDGMTRATQFDNNGSNNVRIEGVANNTIGGTVGTTPGGACTGACNLISGNGFNGGVVITGSGATGNSILGNFIGTNAAGTGNINNETGVTITAAASNNTVGGTTAAARNLITNGVILTAGAGLNTVQGNYIGTDTTGTIGIGTGTLFPNILVAVGIDSSPNNRIGMATGTTLGGACTGGCNLISGNNASHGVLITGAGSTGNRVDYNYIGLNAAGTTALRNGGDAVTLRNGANNNIIGRPLTATPFGEESPDNIPEGNMICIKDDETGNYIQINEITGVFTWKNCKTNETFTGQGEFNNTPVAGVRGFRGNGVNVGFGINGTAYINPPEGYVGLRFIIRDQSIADSICVCPTEGMQTIVGVVGSGVPNDTNPPNNNDVNFNSLGSDTTGTITLSTPTDAYILHNAGNGYVYSNLFINTNGDNFPPISIRTGTDNFITGLDWNGIAPGSTVNYPTDLNDNQIRDPNDNGDLDGGANRTQNHANITDVRRELGGFVRILGSLNSQPNARYRITVYKHYVTFPQANGVSDDIFTELAPFEITTDLNGDATINQVFSGADAEGFLFGRGSIHTTVTSINVAPVTSRGPGSAVVDVLGDTSEFSPPVAVPQPKFDFDEDGKTDIAVYRPGASAAAESIWYILKSSDFTVRIQQFGSGEDKIVPGDYQGDGVADFAVFRPSTGTWYWSRITGNPATNFTGVQWGLPTDIPVPGDYDDDGANDAAVFRPSEGAWYIRSSLDGSFFAQQWGLATDKVAPADYDGDGDTDIAVFRPSNGVWYISPCPVCPVRYESFGLAGDIPVAADYDGDGRADVAVFRPSTGVWYVMRSTAGFFAAQWGLSTDIPLNGDFDADGKNDLAVWRPSGGIWYALRSEQGVFAVQWGQNGDVPVPAFATTP